MLVTENILGGYGDRAGCALLVKTIKSIGDSPNDLYFVFTVQEELGLREETSAYAWNLI